MLSSLTARLLLIGLLLPLTTRAAANTTGSSTHPSAFVTLTHSEALARAKAENKPLLLFFDGHWSDDAQKLSRSTFTDPRLNKFLSEKNIALRVDVLRSPELTQRYRVTSVPQIVLIRADDVLVKRWFKYHSPGDLLDDLRELFPAGSLTDERARFKPDDIHARLEFSTKCLTVGAYAEALEELLWLYNTGIGSGQLEKRHKLRTLHVTTVIQRIHHLGTVFKPARDALHALADREEKNTLRSPDRRLPPTRLVHLLTTLQDTVRLLAVYEKLPPDSKSRALLKSYHDWEKVRHTASVNSTSTPSAVIRLQTEIGLPDSIP
jgi:hypothetical protein